MSADRRYRTVRLIKSGGMAEVHEGLIESGGFKRRVAIKSLHALVDEETWLHRAFADEAQIVSQLHHPNIVSVIDVGMFNDRPFQVLEYVDGIDLSDLLSSCRRQGPSVPVGHALRIAREVAVALDYAHQARDMNGRSMKIVHRDVTPSNILLSWEGEIKLVDFGIATAVSRLEATRAGMVKGKWQYMPPEQRLGRDVDHRADLFSLGCVLYEILSGHVLISSPQIQERLLKGIHPPLEAALPPDLAHLITRMTEPDRERRYPDVNSVIKRLDRALAAAPAPGSSWTSWLSQFRPKQTVAPESTLAEMFQLELVHEASESSLAEYRSVVYSRPEWEDKQDQIADSTGPTFAPTHQTESRSSRSAPSVVRLHIPGWMIALTATACVVAIASLSYAIWLERQLRQARNLEQAAGPAAPLVQARPAPTPEPVPEPVEVASSPPPAKTKIAPKKVQRSKTVARDLARTIREAGLTKTEAESAPELQDALQSVKTAAKSRDSAQTQDALDALAKALESPQLLGRILDQRLSRAKKKLRSASGNLAVSELRPLESQFLDLSVRASAAGSAGERRALLSEVRQLERALNQ